MRMSRIPLESWVEKSVYPRGTLGRDPKGEGQETAFCFFPSIQQCVLGASRKLCHLVFETSLQIGCLYLHIIHLSSDLHRSLPVMKDFTYTISSQSSPSCSVSRRGIRVLSKKKWRPWGLSSSQGQSHHNCFL